MVGKSLLINTTEKLRRISVTDPGIAFAQVITPTQILVHGKSPGEVSLLIWDELERSRSFDLRVDVDVSACADEEHRVFPDEQITVTPLARAVVLSGHVSTEDVAKRAGELASAYSPKSCERAYLRPGRRAGSSAAGEVRRSRPHRPDADGHQFHFHRRWQHARQRDHGTIRRLRAADSDSRRQSDGRGTTTTTATSTVNNVLNLFLFRSDINFGAVIEALENKNLLQILAEPNLIAVNGKEASFLAGGQFPFPIVQPGNGFTAVTISFKEFGVRLAVHTGDHAQRKYPFEGGSRSEHSGLLQRPDNFRIHGPCAEHAQSGN